MMSSRNQITFRSGNICALLLLFVVLLAYQSPLRVRCNLVDLIKKEDKVGVEALSSNEQRNLVTKLMGRFGVPPKVKLEPHVVANLNDFKNPNTMLAKLGGLVNNAVAPVKSYVNLVNRYHTWFSNYKKMQKQSSIPVKTATEVLKEEYTKVDEELKADAAAANAENESESDPAAADDKNKVDESESMDYIFRALRIVIDRLEADLADKEARQGFARASEDDDAPRPVTPAVEAVDQERVKQAMERVKRAVIASAKALVIGESAIIARTAVFHALAQYYDAKPDTGDALDHLRPIVMMLGSAATPVAVSYLMSIEFRAALLAMDSLNPLSLIFGKQKKDESDEKLELESDAEY